MKNRHSILSYIATLLLAFIGSYTLKAEDSKTVLNKTAVFDYTTRTGTISLDSYVTGYIKEVRAAVPADICLVLDFSDSMTEIPKDADVKKTELLKTAATKFIQDIAASATTNNVKHRISIIRFSSRADVMIDWTEVNSTNVTTLINEINKIDNPNNMSTSTRYDYAFYMAKNVIFGGTNLLKGFTPKSYNTKGYAEYDTDRSSYSGTMPNRQFTLSSTSASDMVKGNLSGINVQSSPFVIFLTDGGPTGMGKVIKDLTPQTSSYTHYIDEPGRKKDNPNSAMTSSDPYYDGNRYGNGSSTGAWGSNYNYYTYEQGNIAIQMAKELKDKGVQIFSIYLGSVYPQSAGKTLQCLATDILEGISSKYPEATRYRMCYHGTAVTDTDAYFQWVENTADAEALKIAFSKISSKIEKVIGVQYGVETKMTDFINNTYFKLTDAVDPANPWTTCHVYTVDCKDVLGDGTRTFYEFGKDTHTIELHASDGVNITIKKATKSGENDEISVTGFNYSENWCGKDQNNVIHGKKLIVTVPFEFTGGVDTPVPGTVDTNAPGSGIYPAKRDENGNLLTPIQYDEKPETEYETPKITFCSMIIIREGLDKGESAVYVVKSDGKFVARVSINGTGESSVSKKILYGLPGGTYTVTETGWNWAYEKSTNPISGTLSNSSTPEEFRFTGNHKKVDSGPAEMHNHDEEYKVNKIDVSNL